MSADVTESVALTAIEPTTAEPESATAHTCAPRRYTVTELAKLAQVSRRTMGMACMVADHGIPELIDLCANGKASIRDAHAICRWPHSIQRFALEKFLAGKCKRLAEA